MGDKNNAYLLMLCALATSVAPAAGWMQRSGWLGQLVQYYKNEFFEDLANITPSVDVQAKLMLAPSGYNDSADWDVDSVIRLLYLMHRSPSSQPALAAVRRMLAVSTRRFIVNPAYISKKLSYKLFPSLPEDVYYDGSASTDDDGELEDPWRSNLNITDDTIIVIANPVEARMPSSRISAKKLREILEGRAKAARMMPPTTKVTMPFISVSSTTHKKDNSSDKTKTTSERKTTTPSSNETKHTDHMTTGGGTVTTPAARRHQQRVRAFRPNSFKPPRRFIAIKPKAKRKSLLRKMFIG